MDAKEITAYRTAAASAVATKYLANEKPKILAVMGAGTQAKSHIVVLSKVFKFDEIRVWNHREHSAMSLVHDLAKCGLKLQYMSSPKDAVHNADVVVTATASPTPILQSEWLKTGAHVNAVGAPRPDWQELSEELMRKAVVYVDSSDWARTESGDIVLSGGAAVYAGLHRVRPSTGHQGDHQLPEQQVAPAEHPGRCAPLPCRHRSPQVMDAIEITAYRTAAASAVATKYLATEGPKILAVLGSGTQARSHVRIMTTMFRFEQVRIWNHRESSAASLVQELAAHGISARYEASAEDAVRDADVVVTATSSPKPVLQAGWLKKGAHVNAVGAPRPDWQELSEELMRQAVVYVDSTEGARAESGDVIISGADIFAEIGEVVLGAKENRRSDTTVFKSLGMAMEDVLAADLVYRHLSNDKS
ncbi:uncharacterized protein LOC142578698 isoform X2 [Dermacentor variabilis]